MHANYLFIVGCPRSGTTALGNMFAQHPKVVMGIERYGHRAFPANFSLSPNLFKLERFTEFREGDTFYDSLAFAPAAYSDLSRKFPGAVWVGDKIPTLFRTLPKLFTAFPKETRVLFIFRNIFDVAASYKARKEDLSDNWSKGVSDAISDWADAIRCFRKSDNKRQIIPILYEDLFSDIKILKSLFVHMGLEYNSNFDAIMQGYYDRSRVLEKGRMRNLTEKEVLDICLRAPFGAYREVVETAREFSGGLLTG